MHGRASHLSLRADGLTVACPPWESIPDLLHGVTTRAALPGPGKEDFFVAVRRARQAGALPSLPAAGADQVHEDRIAVIQVKIDWRTGAGLEDGVRRDAALRACEFPATDAMIALTPGLLLVIQTADCLPVFIVDRARRAAGLAHCGWRGLRCALAGALARRMAELGSAPAELEAWLGPCIRAERYEVGRPLIEDFAAAFPGAPVSPDGTHLDLAAIARWQLERAGLAAARIHDSGECTLSRPSRYHSYRGQGPQAGRMLSYMGFA